MDQPRIELPTHAQLVAELKAIRRVGLTRLRDLDLSALTLVERATGLLPDRRDADADFVVVESGPHVHLNLLRAVIGDDMAGTEPGELAEILFGLGERFGTSPPRLRREACSVKSISMSSLRATHERRMFDSLADLMLARCHNEAMRRNRLRMERRSPASSRLAVNWMERFEAYYRMWTPLSGLAGDLVAYRATLLSEEREWDRDPDPAAPEDEGWSQEQQAENYLEHALHRYLDFRSNLDYFQIRHGGHWIASDARTEQELADITRRVQLRVGPEESDTSYLEFMWEHAEGHMDFFLRLVDEDTRASAIREDWKTRFRSCQCTWEVGAPLEREHFATARTTPGIRASCALHSVVTDCSDYLSIVDDEWALIADWYRIDGRERPPGLSAEVMYREVGREDLKREGWRGL